MSQTHGGPARLPKTLLITHFPPTFKNGSIHHIQAVLDRYPGQIIWFSTKSPAESAAEAGPPGVPYEHGWLPSRPSGPRLRPLRQHFVLGLWARKLGLDAAAFGRRHGVELVWAQLSVESVVASRVAARRLGVPLAVSALDDPAVLLDMATGYLDWTRRVFRRQLARTVQYASSHGVISKAMARDYADRHGVDAGVLYVGVAPDERIEPPVRAGKPPQGEAEATCLIGSIGSVISGSNWHLLLEAIDIINRQLGRTAVSVLHIGILPERFHHPRVEVTGWVSGETMRHHLRRLDLCFLSMWFEPERAYSAKTAFPTKIRTFLATQRPVLALGPEDSLAVDFVRGEQLGAVCTEPDAERLAESLQALLFDSERYAAAVSNASRAAEAYSREQYFANFESFLGQAAASAAG